MKQVTLRRTKTGDTGTFGTLEVDGKTFHTGELPWRDNAASVSSIPAGTYQCAWTFSNRFQRQTYQVMGVPDRTGIRFHPANLMGDIEKGYISELNGCIALGRGCGEVKGQDGIIASRDAMRDFETAMAGQPFELTIVDEYQETGVPAENVA